MADAENSGKDRVGIINFHILFQRRNAAGGIYKSRHHLAPGENVEGLQDCGAKISAIHLNKPSPLLTSQMLFCLAATRWPYRRKASLPSFRNTFCLGRHALAAQAEISFALFPHARRTTLCHGFGVAGFGIVKHRCFTVCFPLLFAAALVVPYKYRCNIN